MNELLADVDGTLIAKLLEASPVAVALAIAFLLAAAMFFLIYKGYKHGESSTLSNIAEGDEETVTKLLDRRADKYEQRLNLRIDELRAANEQTTKFLLLQIEGTQDRNTAISTRLEEVAKRVHEWSGKVSLVPLLRDNIDDLKGRVEIVEHKQDDIIEKVAEVRVDVARMTEKVNDVDKRAERIEGTLEAIREMLEATKNAKDGH